MFFKNSNRRKFRRQPDVLPKIRGTFQPILSYVKRIVTEERMSNYDESTDVQNYQGSLAAAFGSASRWIGGAIGTAAAWYAGRVLYEDGLQIAGYLIALNGIWLLLPAITEILRHHPIEIEEVQSPQPAMVRLTATLVVVWFLIVPWSLG